MAEGGKMRQLEPVQNIARYKEGDAPFRSVVQSQPVLSAQETFCMRYTTHLAGTGPCLATI